MKSQRAVVSFVGTWEEYLAQLPRTTYTVEHVQIAIYPQYPYVAHIIKLAVMEWLSTLQGKRHGKRNTERKKNS